MITVKRGERMGFPEQLKMARLSLGYTQQQVADLMGVTKSTYCGYETGKRQPDVEKIKLLANILQTSDDILLETGFSPESESRERGFHVSKADAPDLFPAKKRLIAEIEKMSKPELDAVKVFIDSLDGYKKAFGLLDED